MKDIRSILDVLRSKPGLYISEQSLIELAAFIRGYSQALYDFGQNDPLLDDFPNWVRARLECKVPQSWEKVILFYSSNGSEAMLYFWELMDKYLAERDRTI